MDNYLHYPSTIAGQLPEDLGVTTEHSEPKYILGSRYSIGERAYRYAHIKNDQSLIRKGAVCVSYNSASIERGDKLGAVTQGARTITWTVVGPEIKRNQFANGYLFMEGGEVISIKANAAGARGVAIPIQLNEPIVQSSQSSGRYGMLVESTYSNAMERTFGNTGPGLIIGVTLRDMTEDYYGWLQTWGPCAVIGTQPVLNDSAQITGIHPGTDSGSQVVQHAISAGQIPEERIIGHHVPYNQDNWDSEAYRMLFLTISP